MTPTCRCITTLAAVVLILLFQSSVSAQQPKPIDLKASSLFGLSNTQLLRVCINGSSNTSRGNIPTETDAIFYVIDSSGSALLELELMAPVGGFQCSEVSYGDLVAAGLEPDRTTGALTFRVDVLSSRGGAGTAGASEPKAVGAIMSVDAGTGKIETFHGWTGWSEFYRSL